MQQVMTKEPMQILCSQPWHKTDPEDAMPKANRIFLIFLFLLFTTGTALGQQKRTETGHPSNQSNVKKLRN